MVAETVVAYRPPINIKLCIVDVLSIMLSKIYLVMRLDTGLGILADE